MTSGSTKVEDWSIIECYPQSSGTEPPVLEPPRRTSLPPQNQSPKMHRNFQKAISEHLCLSRSYANPQYIAFSLEFPKSDLRNPLLFDTGFFSHQGSRKAMEDASFCTPIDVGLVAGVFDGHGGSEVSRYVSAAFNQRFAPTLREMHGNVYETFCFLMKSIHSEVASHHEWDTMGTTAVVTIVDTYAHAAYTATLGDSEANIYRQIGNSFKSIPLSCVRNWKSKRDALRAAEAFNNPELDKAFQKADNPKLMYFPPSHGVNVSRAIGDVGLTIENRSAISQKPKITQARVQRGDILVLACDGLKDSVSEYKIVCLMEQARRVPSESLAQILVNFAIVQRFARDNVSVIVIKMM